MTHQLSLWFSPVESGADAGCFAPAVGLLHATRTHFGREQRSRCVWQALKNGQVPVRWFEVRPPGQKPGI